MPQKKQAAVALSPTEGPDAGMIEEGSPLGSPSVRFCPAERRWYHLNCRRERVYDECPAGYIYDGQGNTIPVEETSNNG